jgi:hypothetical protein
MLLMWPCHMTNWQWKKGEKRFSQSSWSLRFSPTFIWFVFGLVCFLVDSWFLYVWGDMLKLARM